jgi:hypothetical protein
MSAEAGACDGPPGQAVPDSSGNAVGVRLRNGSREQEERQNAQRVTSEKDVSSILCELPGAT